MLYKYLRSSFNFQITSHKIISNVIPPEELPEEGTTCQSYVVNNNYGSTTGSSSASAEESQVVPEEVLERIQQLEDSVRSGQVGINYGERSHRNQY